MINLELRNNILASSSEHKILNQKVVFCENLLASCQEELVSHEEEHTACQEELITCEERLTACHEELSLPFMKKDFLIL